MSTNKDHIYQLVQLDSRDHTSRDFMRYYTRSWRILTRGNIMYKYDSVQIVLVAQETLCTSTGSSGT